MKTIKIFLASSEELKPERLELADLVENINNVLEKQDITVRLVKWEYLDSSMGPQHKQEDYNDKLRECEMCIVLFWTKFGMYTKTELDIAYNESKMGNNPRGLHVYFKESDNPSEELKAFHDSFRTKYNHFPTPFANFDTLKAHFLLQFMGYLSQTSQIEVKDGKVIVGNTEYVNLEKVPFVGNNEEYNLLLKNIKITKKLIATTDEDDTDYAEYVENLQQLQEKLANMESSLWDTALMITRLSTTKCSERLNRAMDLFSKGDNKGAQAILNEDAIEKDIEHNLKLIKLGEEGLIINIDEYRLKIKILHCNLNKDDYDKIIALRKKVLELCIHLYGEASIEVAEEYHELANEFGIIGGYVEAQTNYEKARDIYKDLGMEGTLNYADILRGLGRLHVTNDMFLRGKTYLDQALAIIGDKFGENNLTYVKSLRDMSLFYRNMDLYDEAIDSARKALDILESLPDFDKGLHNSIKRIQAIAYSDKVKRIDYAITKDKDDLDKAVNLLIEVYESEIEDKKASINNLYLIGQFFERNHKWHLKNTPPMLIEAANYYTKALAIAKKIDDKNNTNMLLEKIGSVYKTLGTPEKAEALGYSYPKAEANDDRAWDDRAWSEVLLEYRKEKEKIDMEVAQVIATLYLDKFPRKQSYGVTLSSTEDDSIMTFYHELSKEEIEILHNCSSIAIEEDCTLDEILSEEGHQDLVEKLVENSTLMPLNILDSVDLDNPLEFTSFHFQSIKEDGTLGYKQEIGTPLTDDEFKEILIELLLHSNRYSMNMLVYHKPELCQKIIKHITYASMDYEFENWHTYIADMYEHKDICEKILNPFIDILNIFNSDDKAIAKFALRHQIVPDDDNEIYIQDGDTDSFHLLIHFHGTRLDFMQEGKTAITHKYHDYKCFSIDGQKFMEKFSLKTPKEILPYLKEHFNTLDCIYRIMKKVDDEK